MEKGEILVEACAKGEILVEACAKGDAIDGCKTKDLNCEIE